jgi:N-acetylated-alpha-linked acidic dipeptidase
LLDEARSIGALVKSGWQPKRTIVYTSWDGEEPMLLGSTEWVEQHADELKQKAVIYINTDGNSRGFMRAEGTQDLGQFATQAAASVTDPEAHVSVDARARARLATAALSPASPPDVKEEAKLAAEPGSSLPMGAPGSGSDFSGFVDHLGVTTLSVGFGGEEAGGGVYHSRYDTFEHHSKFVDPGFVYDAMLAKTITRAVLLAADSNLPLQQPGDFADACAQYASELKKLADDHRTAAQNQAKLLAANAYALSADPRLPHADPVALKTVPAFDFAPLDDAVTALKKSAAAYDAAIAAKGAQLSPAARGKLLGLMQSLDQTLLLDQGLPGRPWYRNSLYAPGRFTGYGAKTMPGIREAIEDERLEDVQTYIGLTAGTLKAYAARLDQAVALLQG